MNEVHILCGGYYEVQVAEL